MRKELKQAIVNFIFENDKEFQLLNRTKEVFREYIYNSKGNYLIGGEDVALFIEQSIKLIVKES
jgi:hypothetical protein